MAITAEQMLPTRSQNQLFIQQKISVHGCDVGRLSWETSAQPGRLARGRLGPGALTMLIKTCDKFMSSAQTTDCPGDHQGCHAFALTIPAVLLQPRLHRGSNTCWHGPGWRFSHLGTAKMPKKYKKCSTKHRRVGVLRCSEHISQCPHITCLIHPNSPTWALPPAQTPAEGLAYGKVLDWNGATVEGTALGAQNWANGDWNGATDYKGLS